MKLSSAPRAANVPVFMLVFCALLSFGAVAAVTTEPALWSVGLAVFVLVMNVLVVSKIRSIRIEGGELITRTLFGSHRVDIANIALGERVRHSQGHKYYDLYATDGGGRVDLTDAMTARGSARAQARLQAMITEATGKPARIES